MARRKSPSLTTSLVTPVFNPVTWRWSLATTTVRTTWRNGLPVTTSQTRV